MEKIMVLGKKVPIQAFEKAKECEDLACSRSTHSHESTGYFMEARGILRGVAMVLDIDYQELRSRYIEWYLDRRMEEERRKAA